MRFQEFRSTWPFMLRQSKQHGVYLPWKSSMEMLQAVCIDRSIAAVDPIGWLHNMVELHLEKAGRPYYDLYPSIVRPLLGLKLDLDCSLVEPPREDLGAFTIRFVEGNQAVDGACSIGVAFLMDQKRIAIGIDTGGFLKSKMEFSYPSVSMISFTLEPGRTIEQQLNRPIDVGGHKHTVFNTGTLIENFNRANELTVSESAKPLGMEHLVEAVRIVISICLIGTGDEMLVAPEVLNKDKDKWKGASEEERQRLINRAKKRGKFGFSLGKDIEVIPHYRRGHPALVWTGKGRKIPQVVWRKGSLVHREVVEKVPTGYEGESLE